MTVPSERSKISAISSRRKTDPDFFRDLWYTTPQCEGLIAKNGKQYFVMHESTEGEAALPPDTDKLAVGKVREEPDPRLRGAIKYLSNPSNSGKESYEKIFPLRFGGVRAVRLVPRPIQSRRWASRLR